MNINRTILRVRRSRSGMTLLEVMITSSISLIAMAAVMSVYIWCARLSAEVSKKAWSENMAMKTSERLTMMIRNASSIAAIDEVGGNWIELAFPDNSMRRIVYTNAMPELRDGHMFITSSNDTRVLVARGLTAIQNSGGFSLPVFTKSASGAVRVSIRVSEPAASGNLANDSRFACSIRFAVFPRNTDE